MALSVARCHLPEAPRGRPHRVGGGNHRRRREHPGAPRDRRPGPWSLRSRGRASDVAAYRRSAASALAQLAALMDDSEHDVLAYMTFPFQPRTKLHSTNPWERLNKKVKRRADVVGIFPNKASIARLIGAVLLEQNDEWLIQHRYMPIEGMAQLTPPLIDTDPAKLPPLAA